MRTSLLIVVVLLGACSSKKKNADSQPPPPAAKEPAKETSPSVDTVEAGNLLLPQGLKSVIEKNLGDGKVMAFGKKYAAEKFCSPETIASPRRVQIFRIRGMVDMLAYHCPGSTSVTTLFRRTKPPRTQHTKVESSSSVLSAKEIEDIIRALLKSSNETFPA